MCSSTASAAACARAGRRGCSHRHRSTCACSTGATKPSVAGRARRPSRCQVHNPPFLTQTRPVPTKARPPRNYAFQLNSYIYIFESPPTPLPSSLLFRRSIVSWWCWAGARAPVRRINPNGLHYANITSLPRRAETILIVVAEVIRLKLPPGAVFLLSRVLFSLLTLPVENDVNL